MKTYNVQLEMHSDIEIEAETEEEAIHLAKQKSRKELRPQFEGCEPLVCDYAEKV